MCSPTTCCGSSTSSPAARPSSSVTRWAGRRPGARRALVVEEPVVDNWDRDWRAQYYKDVRAALDKSAEPSAFKRAVASLPLPARGPRGERTVGEVRGFYA